MPFKLASHKSNFHFDDSTIDVTKKTFIKRAIKAIGFIRAYLHVTNPHELSARHIDSAFTSQSNIISQYLRLILLKCTNERFSADKNESKEYIINKHGLAYLCQLVEGKTTLRWLDWRKQFDVTGRLRTVDAIQLLDSPLVVEAATTFIVNQYKEQLETCDFVYTEKSDRLWNPIQNIRRDIKKPILAKFGLEHQYDIQTCAPTLIHEHAVKLGMQTPCMFLRDYLTNKTTWRNEIAMEVGTDARTIKVLINALFCGAKLGRSHFFSLFRLVNSSHAVMSKLMENERIRGLQGDIRTCWKAIEPSIGVEYITDKNGKQRKSPLSCKRKWAVYFALERKVLEVVMSYMRLRQFKFFLEHDGWACTNRLDLDELGRFINQHTGFWLGFDYEHIGVPVETVDEETGEIIPPEPVVTDHPENIVLVRFSGNRVLQSYGIQLTIPQKKVMDFSAYGYRYPG